MRNWHTHAKSALKSVFGTYWREFVLWDNGNSGFASSVSEEQARIARNIENIRLALSSLPQSDERPNIPVISIDIPQTNKKPSTQMNIFIVHGHDDKAKLELKNYLQNILNLPEPIILHEKPNYGQAIIEKFESYANSSNLAFVLLTPDDVLVSQNSSIGTLYRARQNVIFEMGYFLGLFGRKEGRVILLYKGSLDIPSDISGVVYIDISNGILAAGEQIRNELSRFLLNNG